MVGKCVVIFLSVLTLMNWAVPARAEVQVKQVLPGAGASWALLEVRYRPAGAFAGDTLQVRDGRGGPMYGVSIAGSGGERILVPLPLVAASDLEGTRWPLELAVRAKDGRLLEFARVAVDTTAGRNGEGRRVLVAGDSSLARTVAVSDLTAEIPEEAVIAGPSALFLTADLLVVSPELIRRLEEPRLVALLATGIRLAVPSSAPPITKAPYLTWNRTDGGDGARLWITAPLPIGRPAIIEAGFEPLVATASRRPLDAAARGLLWMTFPATGVVFLLAWGLLRRRRLVLAGSALGVVALNAAGMACLRAFTREPVPAAQWRITTASTERATPRVELSESLTIVGGRTGLQQEWSSADAVVLPVVAKAADYWRLGDVQWPLDSQRLEIKLPPSQFVGLLSRSVAVKPLLPALPPPGPDLQPFGQAMTLPAASVRLVQGGYITSETPPRLFSAWAESEPALRGSALAWYALRFDARHTYVCGSGAEGCLDLLDLGEVSPGAATLP